MDFDSLPDPLFPAILRLLPLRRRLKLCSVSKFWCDTIHGHVTDLVVVDTTEDFVNQQDRRRVDTLLCLASVDTSRLAKFLSSLPQLRRLDLRASKMEVTSALLYCSANLKAVKVKCQTSEILSTLKSLANIPVTLSEVRLSWDGPTPPHTKQFLDCLCALLKQHGPTLTYFKLPRVPFTFSEDTLAKISLLAPKLTFFSHTREHFNLFPNLETVIIDSEDVSEDLFSSVKWSIEQVFLQRSSHKNWKVLSDPRLKTLKKIEVPQGPTTEDFTELDSHYYHIPPDKFLVDISDVFRNNSHISRLKVNYFPKQIESIAPFLRNLTHASILGYVPTKTWLVIGRELRSLFSLEVGSVYDKDIEAWVSEMPEKIPLSILKLYLNSSPKIIATHVLPHCPNLSIFDRSSLWDDDTLAHWSKTKISPKSLAIEGPQLSIVRLSEFFRECGKNLLELELGQERRRMAVELPLSDEFIEDLVTYCPNLVSLQMRFVQGVSAEGWQKLKRLQPLQYVNIGSDTCSQELTRELTPFSRNNDKKGL